MYAILCDYAAGKDHCWPSQATLAGRLSCSISSVKNYLAELVREKLISIRREHYRSSVYYLLRPEELASRKSDVAGKKPKVDPDEAKSGYLITLNKQRKEKESPLPPGASGQRETRPRSSTTPAAGGVTSVVLQDFESIWAAYPKKHAKGFARLAWLQLLRSGQLPPLPELRDAIRRFADSESWQREQGRFVPQLGNWLRGQRWLDLPPSGQTDRGNTQDLRRAVREQEEQEQRRHAAWSADKARLRPQFEAFAAKFPSVANQAMAFGIWLHLHSLHCAPSADDVPQGNSLEIVGFLNDFKQKARTAAYRASQPLRHEGRHSRYRFVGGIPEVPPSLPGFFRTGNWRAGQPPEILATAYT